MEEKVACESASVDLRVPFPSSEAAVIAYNTLRVDPEPKRSKVSKTLSTENNILCVTFKSSEARTLRVCVNSFMDHLVLVTQTMEQFGEPSLTSGGGS